MNLDNFKYQLAKNDLNPDSIIPDGKIHRFKTGGSGESGWYVCFMDSNSIGGSFGDWRTGLAETYSEFNNNVTVTEKKEILIKIQETKEKASKERKRLNKKAEEKALWIWENSESVFEHDYLKNKKVKSHGLKLYKSNIVIPITSSDKKIKSLQFIDHEGGKRFLGDSVIEGNAFKIPGNIDKIYICEGYSTGATIAEITGNLVVCAFNSGNLPHVAKKVRRAFPKNKIVIAADNDKFNKVNVGIMKAEQSANSINATMIYPKFSDETAKFTDFNDLFVEEGQKVCMEQLNEIKSGLFDEVKKYVQATNGSIKLFELNNHFDFREKSEKDIMLKIVEQLCKQNILKKARNKSFVYKIIDMTEEELSLDAKPEYADVALPFELDEFVDIPKCSIIIISGESNGGKTACSLATVERNIEFGHKNITYFSSEMESNEYLDRILKINPDRRFWEDVKFFNRNNNFSDLIVGERKNGIVIIDYLEPLGEKGYAGIEETITEIRESLDQGIAIINLQKTTGNEYARGGEGTSSKARLYITLSKGYKCDEGYWVNVCKVIKNKINKEDRVNVDGRSCFFIPSASGIHMLSTWQYANQDNIKAFMKELQEEFPAVDNEKITLQRKRY